MTFHSSNLINQEDYTTTLPTQPTYRFSGRVLSMKQPMPPHLPLWAFRHRIF